MPNVLAVKKRQSFEVFLGRRAVARLTWEKIIANEHAEQDKVIHDVLQAEWEGQRSALKFQFQVIAHKPGRQQHMKIATTLVSMGKFALMVGISASSGRSVVTSKCMKASLAAQHTQFEIE